MKKRPDLNSDDEWFLGRFQNEAVAVVTELEESILDENGGVITKPLAMTGFLIHMDSNFIYLGDTVELPTQAISRSKVVAVMDMATAIQTEEIPFGHSH